MAFDQTRLFNRTGRTGGETGTAPGDPEGRSQAIRVGVLSGLVALQGVCALYFLGDVAVDYWTVGFDTHTAFETLAALALSLGLVFGVIEMARAIRIGRRAEDISKTATAAFSALMRERFDEWHLTPSEIEVAMLALKGMDPAAIARLRGTATGTVRAQLAGIYTKSGCSGRGEFVSVFVSDFLSERKKG